MTGYVLAGLVFLGGMGAAVIGELVNEEIRGWLDYLPRVILRLAAKRLGPADKLTIYEDEWLPELTCILRGAEARPISRLIIGVRFSIGLLITARRIARHLRRVPHDSVQASLPYVQLIPTSDFMDNFVAPGYSSFTAAIIPDMPVVGKEQGHWLTNFILNSSGLRGFTLDDDTRRTLFNFLRRTEAALGEYQVARELTLAHLANPKHKEYIRAIDGWERFLSQADRAWAVFVRGQSVLFDPNDGSVFQRLRLLCNRTTHLETAIRSGQLPLGGTVPVWLTNDGLQAVDVQLTFAEIADMLTDLAKWADAAQDPSTMRETIGAWYGLSEEDEGES